MKDRLILRPAGRVGTTIVYDHLDDDGHTIGTVRVLADGRWVARLDSLPLVVQATSLADLREKLRAAQVDAASSRPQRRFRWPW